jgi:hypothetical protein
VFLGTGESQNHTICGRNPAVCSPGSVTLWSGRLHIKSSLLCRPTYSWPLPVATGHRSCFGYRCASFARNINQYKQCSDHGAPTVTPKSGTCTGSSFTVSVVVNPKPSIVTKLRSSMQPRKCNNFGSGRLHRNQNPLQVQPIVTPAK